ncbi:unnamed protein product [Prorocentrum cordatum]|uniref:RING-type domain-containing protein n=1 Tax=Prorocentrum cordatum TaxID=2364126 RepID=A0ABN9WU24_9DINO|nr:unnamed protein product [Polarella glacialis]
MTFTCEVCFESKENRLPLGKLATGNGDVIRGSDCGHNVCIECTSAFVKARVEEQLVFGIRCPHDGCRNELYEKDIEQLARDGLLEDAVRERFCELRSRDYAARASSFSEDVHGDNPDYSTIRRLYESTRLCPRCKLVIEKSHGCNSFFCICGFHFNYQSAPRIVGNGISRYDKVLDFAEKHGLALREVEKAVGSGDRACRVLDFAERHGLALSVVRGLSGHLGLYEKAQHLACQVGVAFEDPGADEHLREVEALDLQIRAFHGDSAAREEVRAMRAAARVVAAAEGERELFELPALDFLAGTEAEDVVPQDELPAGTEVPPSAPPVPEVPAPPVLVRALSDGREGKRRPVRLQRAASCAV